MRPYVVGGACHRVQQHLDNALTDGVLNLPPELAAHAARCQHCGHQVQETEALFRRLRNAPANLDLGPVPGAVDSVLQRIATGPTADNLVRLSPEPEKAVRRRKANMRWIVGQVATIAAVLGIAVGGVTYLALKVNQAVGGVPPSEVVERWVAPLHDWSKALFGNTK